MGLKDLKSNLDLIQGSTNPVGEMETTVPTGFDNGVTSTLHTDSLTNLTQDLNAAPDPDYNRIQDSSSPFATEDHMIDLLENKPVLSTNSSTLYQAGQGVPLNDLDGVDGPQFGNGASSTFHTDTLLQQYQYQHGNSTTTVGPVPGPNSPVPQSLDGAPGPKFVNEVNELFPNILVDSMLSTYQYQHGNSSATVGPSTLDGNGSPIGQYNYNTDPDSPFLTPTMGGDHMITLLTQKVKSQNTNQTYAGAGFNGIPQDLNGADYGEGLFNEHNNNGELIGLGKQIGGQDLHVHLLKDGYAYQHGIGTQTGILQENGHGHSGGAFDLDGSLPSSGQYLDNQPD
tara:strand:- start:463 stop:1485 length:1023 start_codon:yes stop_codon:yes gene_type:complete